MQPLIRGMLHEQFASVDRMEMSCCDHPCPEADTGNQPQPDDHCTEECACVVHNPVLYSVALSYGMNSVFQILGEWEAPDYRYHFTLPATIWNPPEA